MLPTILPLASYLKETIWGGDNLARHYNKKLPPNCPIGESWEVSAYPGQESTVCAGPLSGSTLRAIAQIHGRELLGQSTFDRYRGEFPLLIKLLDARQDLSIQVHPDDSYVQKHSLGTFGKMEAWYILRSENGRVAYGLKPGITPQGFEMAVQENRTEDVVQFFPVHPGDVVFVPPGTVHALCQGVMIYEVQQSSDLTFRIYDYNRTGPDGSPRELHVDQARDVIAFNTPEPEPVSWKNLCGSDPTCTLLVASEHFRLERFAPESASTEHNSGTSFSALTVIAGQAEISAPQESFPAKEGSTFLIPAERAFTLSRQGNLPLEYLISSVPETK
ncbi:MAG: class I mannose-6-phosphate isomerase [bacterium]|nr:class I mannose-6-phosphate isomerase [bacterium]